MARTLHVYPQAALAGAVWTYNLDVSEPARRNDPDRGSSFFTHIVPAGVVAVTPLRLLKVVFTLVTPDSTTDQDVDDALFVDDIRPGPQTETVWGNWQAKAEGIIAGLPLGYTVADFWAGWRTQDTSSMRQDARRALVTQRGWTVTAVHQHEGDRQTVTEE